MLRRGICTAPPPLASGAVMVTLGRSPLNGCEAGCVKVLVMVTGVFCSSNPKRGETESVPSTAQFGNAFTVAAVELSGAMGALQPSGLRTRTICGWPSALTSAPLKVLAGMFTMICEAVLEAGAKVCEAMTTPGFRSVRKFEPVTVRICAWLAQMLFPEGPPPAACSETLVTCGGG